MKKQLLTLLMAMSIFSSYAQSFKEDPSFVKPSPNSNGYMLDTVVSSSLTKHQIYSNAISFLTNRFKDSRSVIESKDLELGEITFKGNAKTSYVKSDTTKKGKITNEKWDIPLFFKCKIYVNDNKFKIVLNSLETAYMVGLSGHPLDPYNKGPFSKGYKASSELAIDIIRDLSISLNKKPENEF